MQYARNVMDAISKPCQIWISYDDQSDEDKEDEDEDVDDVRVLILGWRLILWNASFEIPTIEEHSTHISLATGSFFCSYTSFDFVQGHDRIGSRSNTKQIGNDPDSQYIRNQVYWDHIINVSRIATNQ